MAEGEKRWIRSFAEASPDAILGFDGAGLIVLCNPRAKELFGHPEDELLGAPIQRLLPDLDLSPALGLTAGTRLELTARRQDAVAFPARVSITPIQAGDLILLAIVRDISDQKSAERDRIDLLASERAARSEAERANMMKDEFLATLSHELRTPLNAMLGWTQILRIHSSDRATVSRAVETIERNIRVQAQLIEDLLDMSRIVSGKLGLCVEPTALAPIIAAALEVVSQTAEDKGIVVTTDLDPAIGHVLGDAHRLQQVVWNLLSNAVKFTAEGGQVGIRARQVGSFVRLEVYDTGQGIDPLFLPHLFDRFRQADSSTTRHQGGLGLGLSIVRSLVEMHRGTICAESAGLGRGATFIILLPLSGAIEAESPPRALPRISAVDALAAIKGIRVLVVDDERDSRDFLRRVLEDFGAIVMAAASAAEAFRTISTNRPDVILCDIGMPGEDGYQFILKVRALGPEQGGRIPAAALTAYTREPDRRKALELGYQVHVSKPVEPLYLAEVVAVLAREVPPRD